MFTFRNKLAFTDIALIDEIAAKTPDRITPENRDEFAKLLLQGFRSHDESKLTPEEYRNGFRILDEAVTGGIGAVSILPYLDDKINKLNTTDLKSLATKALVGGLLGGGVGAVGTEAQPGETREQKRKRLIRNALVGAAGGAGLGALSEVKMGSIKSALADAVKNIDLTNPVLLAGLGSAGTAGLLTALNKKNKKETLGKKSLDVLTNAALAGALGAGSAALLRKGSEQFSEALPVEDVDPTSQTLKSPWAALLGGGLGAGAAGKFTKNLQGARAEQELINYAKKMKDVLSAPGGATEEQTRFVKELNKLIDNKDFQGAKGVLSRHFGDAKAMADSLSKGLGGNFSDEESMRKFLRYLKINPSTIPPGTKGFIPNLKGGAEDILNSLKGKFERGIDARMVQGAGGRFKRVGAGVAGAVAGAALPYAVTQLNDYLQTRE